MFVSVKSPIVLCMYFFSVLNILFIAFDGERNPNSELDGLPVLYKPRNFDIFRSWTAIWTSLLVFAGAGFVFESGLVVKPCWPLILADFYKN